MMNRQLSYHEAGHAVLRIILGGEIHYACVSEDDPHVRPKTVLAAEDERIVTLSGIVSEFQFCPAEAKVGHWGGDDWERASRWPQQERNIAAARAKELVAQHSVAIEKVAQALLKSQHGLVLGERIQRIVKGESINEAATQSEDGAGTLDRESSGQGSIVERPR